MALGQLCRPGATSIIFLACLGAIYVQAQHTAPSIDILQQKGCDVGASLEPNMQDCVINELMGSNGTLTFSFNVAPRAKHSVLFTLRSVGGSAVMRLYNSGDAVYNGQVVYYNDAVTESFLRVPSDQLTAGQYTLVVQGMGGATQKLLLYLRVQTPPASVRLAAADKTAMLSILKECCPGGKSPMAPEVCTTFLPAALNAKAPEDDLCNIGDFVCDDDGHLQKIDFSNAGLVCKNFPAAFGDFPALETLMLRYNDFGGDTLTSVAEVLGGTPSLRRLMMGATNLTGTVPCSLFEDLTLKTVMFSINKLEGSLPECVLASPSLEELYMSRVTLTGPLPDSIPVTSNLRVWYAINKDPMTGDQPGPGFSGELPPSIANAAGLAFVELSNHELSGGVPALPEGIKMFEAHSNLLDGGIASPLPAGLVYFDVMNNSLIGPIPDFSESPELTLFDASSNKLEGSLPDSMGAAGDSLVYLDLSNNTLEGPINPGTLWERVPEMQYCFLQQNYLEGPVPASFAASTKLVALNVAHNRLDGDLTAFAGAINPPPAASPQQGGRKLQSSGPATSHACHHGTYAVAKKLFGSYEEYTAPTPSGWNLDVNNIRDLATHQTDAARRRLQQAGPTTAPATPAVPAAAAAAAPVPEPAAEVPAAGGATTTVVAPPQTAATAPSVTKEPIAATPAAPAPLSTPVAGGATTTVVAPQTPEAPTPVAPEQTPTPLEEVTQETPGAAPLTQEQEPSAPAPQGPQDSNIQMENPQSVSAEQNDIGIVPIPTASALAGNSFLYLNTSNNMITGPVPEELGYLEMFRSPANSTDPYDMYVYNRGGPDRTLDLTNNQLYGEFPLFLIDQPTDLSDACLCATSFNVSEGNYLLCPTKGTLGAMKTSKAELEVLKQANYTCLVPGKAAGADPTPVSLAQYLNKPADWLTAIPAASEVVKEKATRAPREAPTGGSLYASQSSSSSSGGPLGPGAIAGIVVGALAGVAILGSLAYFVGYKRFYSVHKATSFKRGQIPDGPGLNGQGAYPAAAYGGAAAAAGAPGPGPTNGFDIETPAAPR